MSRHPDAPLPGVRVVADDNWPAAAAGGHDVEVPPATPVRVLVVDDDPAVGGQLRELLTDYGHNVIGLVSNSIQALVLIKTLRPEVVLTDLRMPGMSGVQLTVRVRELPSPPEVVVISAYDDASLQQEARAAGAHGYVVKGAPGELVHRAVLSAAATRREDRPGTSP